MVMGAILGISCLVGLWRGATREVTSVTALILAVAVALLALRITGPLMHLLVSAMWLANILAVIGGFAIVYIGLRLAGSALIQGVRASGLSGLDRGLGFVVGFLRGWVVIAGLVMLIEAALPVEHLPPWIGQAALFPLAETGGKVLGTLAPQGYSFAREMAPALGRAISKDDQPTAETPPATAGDKSKRDHLKLVVEKAQ